MKTVLRIYSWIIISVLLQVAILLFVDKVYLGQRLSGQGLPDIDLKFEEFTPEVTEIDKSINVKVPQGIKDTKMSYDGLFVSYILDGKVEIIDAKNQANKVVVENKINDTLQGQLMAYKWMADRNIIIYIVKTSLPNGSLRLWIMTYNIDSGDYDGYFENRSMLVDLPKDSKVSSFEFSSKTKVLYLKVDINNVRSRIYRYNIMEDIFFIGEFDSSIVFDMTRLDDYLVIEENNKFQTISGISPWKKQPLNVDGKYSLLKVDTDDNVYLGELNGEGKIQKIIYGKYNEEPSGWQTISLKNAADKNEIFVKENGVIYQNVSKQNIFYKISDNKNISYKENLIDILQNCYIIQSEGNIKIIPLKK